MYSHNGIVDEPYSYYDSHHYLESWLLIVI
nr:MAG TPA: hypothetical protein [Crassvirales sp.]